MPSSSRKPLWLWPNLLSLDAPLVAVVWLYVFAQTWRLGYHPWEAYVSLALAVWSIYVVDRLLDASMALVTSGKLEARHDFHYRHRVLFGLGAVVAALASVVMVITSMPMTIYKYLLLGLVLVGGFFGLSMVSAPERNEVPHMKNILAGVTFAFGTAMMAHIYRPEMGIAEMVKSQEYVCFAVLCVLNISAIDLWEHAASSPDLEIKASDEMALTLPLGLLGGAALLFALLDEQFASRPFFWAILTGAALLHVLNRTRTRYSGDLLRVLADVALLIPVIVFVAAMSE